MITITQSFWFNNLKSKTRDYKENTFDQNNQWFKTVRTTIRLTSDVMDGLAYITTQSKDRQTYQIPKIETRSHTFSNLKKCFI